jgi:hypothetical protein
MASFKDRVYRELWAVHEFYRKLGFPSENIFVTMNKDTKILGCMLKHNGEQYEITLGRVDQQPNKFYDGWEQVCNCINNGTVTDEELDEAWNNSAVLMKAPEILLSMKAKGIEPIYDKN